MIFFQIKCCVKRNVERTKSMNITLDEETVNQLVALVTQQVLQQLPIACEQKPNVHDTRVERYMNQKQVCEYLNVSAHTINSYVKQGLKIVQINDGSRTYYDKHDVDAFMADHKISCT